MFCFGFPCSRSTLTYWKESLGAQDVQGEADRTGFVRPEDENKGEILIVLNYALAMYGEGEARLF